jgi:toxin-antitoxin system PIN domain toxin
MASSVFPDINVWLAMASSAHVHHVQARTWYESLRGDEGLIFCRFTQLGLLRLLTTSGAMGNRVKTQRQAWEIYDEFLFAGNARLMPEPLLLDESFRRLANLNLASPKDWADSYLAAFAREAAITLVTFDKALAGRAPRAVLLKG